MSAVLAELLTRAPRTIDQTVPDELMGCWRRNWIRFGDDGDTDRSVAVIWLQTASGMGDIRIDPSQLPTETDSSCGITVVDRSTTPYPTADWLDGDTGFSQQPVSRFPEKGWLDWKNARLMHELAPSGAYVEEWERLDDDAAPIGHFVASDSPTATNLYVAGRHVLLARRRTDDAVLDEFSYGRHSPDDADPAVIIELSTIDDRVGREMYLDHDWSTVNLRT